MGYLELIQRFWDFNQRKSVGSTGIAMYLYLLKITSDNESYDFQISDVAISKELGLTRKTVKSTKEKLKNLGLIQFETKNGLPCNYRLILDYPLSISELKNEERLMVSPIQIFPKSTNIEVELQSAKVTQLSQPQQSSIQKGNDKNIPSLEKFIEYAKTLENYESQLDLIIEEKYENWVNNGWKNGSDRPITNWKSTLKSSLPFMKNATENHQLSLQSIPQIKRPKS